MRSPKYCLGVLLLTAGTLAWIRTGQEWLWMDECFTVLESIGQVPFVCPEPLERTFDSREFWGSNDLAGVHRAALAGDNGNQFLSILLMHGLVSLFGPDRPSVLFVPGVLGYLLGIAWCFRLGRGLFSDRVGWLAAALFACHRQMLFFAVELRSYSLAVCACLIASEFYLRIVGMIRNDPEAAMPSSDRLRRWIVAYVVFSLLALFMHYLSALVLVGHAIFAVAAVRDRRAWTALVVSGAIVASTFLVIRASLLPGPGYAVADAYNAYARRVGHLPGLPAGLYGLIELFHNCVFEQSGFFSFTSETLMAVVAATALAAGMRRMRADHKQQPGDSRILFLVILASVMPVAAFAGHLANLSILPNAARYQIFSAPFFAILMARALDALSTARGHIANGAGSNGISGIPGRLTVALYLMVMASGPVLLTLSTIIAPNRNDYLVHARQIAARYDRSEIRMVEVPSILDCQMLAFYLGPERSVPLRASDTGRTREVVQLLNRLNLQHPLSVFMETKYGYAAEGMDYSRFEIESDTGGVLRIRYARLEGKSTEAGESESVPSPPQLRP